ncbi:L-seryl-tRNA(Sec) selenium transferase [Brachybacterium faecium DSM 4810]|uniref:L-seryl-tRNA(Sec) selenium transferase n=1 Tax=Brachybacterium faecium (strain ATCC 43885 / DSM 4810 / JCM 11609 / LMG 19847 / NBRC 14762 / NCIMB 9860 / 6-10) TaxID=446465 RepID=C7MAQ7_BRAFD|nr:L-seryl-tRNA(Sec) selenium transferase [Brachybacterium faecium]ACU84815.1 L-seryl-tRNA(Sec) selenium transferase [Brachybacterium faecium DSM 4810]
MSADPRRRIPRTDHLLAHPDVAAAAQVLSEHVVRGIVRGAQERARRGEIAAEAVLEEIRSALGGRPAGSLRPVLNATGVIVHTNLGRAPLSPAARAALQDAAGYTDVEFDLAAGVRSRRGAGARAALLAACPEAEDALIVNNGAAALALATTALAGTDEVILSRGELIEIGAGFRLPELITSTGARLREVGTTNRTHLADYTAALGPSTGCVLRVHTSNYRVIGFTSEVAVAELAGPCREAGVPLVADLGSGLLEPEPRLPAEPAAAAALRDGADLVIASGDKLLGGPQAGILLGRAEIIARLARHPLARAMRADKLTLAALEATLRGPVPPVLEALRLDPDALRERTAALADRLGGRLVAHEGRVGGGGGAEVPLPGWALALDPALAAPLRTGDPAVVATVRDDCCLLDLRCVPAEEDARLEAAVRTARTRLDPAGAQR